MSLTVQFVRSTEVITIVIFGFMNKIDLTWHVAMSGMRVFMCCTDISLQLTWRASSLLEVDVAEVQHAGHHPEQVQLLRVVQADLLHGHAHPVEVALVVQQRVLQRARFQVLRGETERRQLDPF